MKWIALLHGIASWFDVVFNGSEHVVVLSTAPSSPGTHWYQCRLLFENPLAVNKGQQVSGKIVMDVNDNKSYNIKVDSMPPSRGAMTPLAWIDNCTPKISTSGYYHLHDQYCYVCPPLPSPDRHRPPTTTRAPRRRPTKKSNDRKRSFECDLWNYASLLFVCIYSVFSDV